jgi:hypothetical protein
VPDIAEKIPSTLISPESTVPRSILQAHRKGWTLAEVFEPGRFLATSFEPGHLLMIVAVDGWRMARVARPDERGRMVLQTESTAPITPPAAVPAETSRRRVAA